MVESQNLEKRMEKVALAFGLGDLVEVKRENHGIINHLYRVKTKTGTYMFRAPRKGTGEKLLKNRDLEYKVTAHLTEVGFPYEVPLFLKDGKGKELVYIDGTFWDAYKRIGGKHPKSRKDCRAELIELMAKYHEEMNNFKGISRPKNSIRSSSGEEFSRKVDDISKGDSNISKLINLYKELILDAYYSVKGAVPTRDAEIIVHSDMHPGNILCKGDKVTGLIDFGNIKWGTEADDLIRLKLRTLDETTLAINEYKKHRDLPVEEEKVILPLSILKTVQSLFWAYRSGTPEESFERVKKKIKILEETRPFWEGW